VELGLIPSFNDPLFEMFGNSYVPDGGQGPLTPEEAHQLKRLVEQSGK